MNSGSNWNLEMFNKLATLAFNREGKKLENLAEKLMILHRNYIATQNKTHWSYGNWDQHP